MDQQQTEPCPECGSLLDVTGAPTFAERTCPVCEAKIRVNRRFGRYEVLELMGQGGQGTVYRAVDTTLSRQVALKIMRTEYGSDPVFVRQFEHEAQLTASINHPNVVRVYSFGTEEGRVYLAMELVDGGTFDDLMEQLGRVPEARALQVGIQIAQGLRAGFEKGLIHRDVKPGNILFAGQGTAKIVDFGLAVLHEHEAQTTGDIWGTPYYLSPERLNRQQEDFRSDIYSLGASLFHAIAGRPPFEAEDASQVALKHLNTRAVSIQTFAPDVSNSTAYVINRTLAKNREERQSSYDEFIAQLQFARDEVLASKRGGQSPQKSRLVLEDDSTKRFTSWITLATLAILLLAIIVGVVLTSKMFREREKGDPTTSPTPQAIPNSQQVQSGPASLDFFGPRWGDARAKFLNRNWSQASSAFSALAIAHAPGSMERDWALIHQAMAEQFMQGSGAAEKILRQLQDSSTGLRRFFREDIRRQLGTGKPIRAEAASRFGANNHEVLGALFFALHNYWLGEADDAGKLFRQFTSLKPESSLAWLSEYGKLAKPYQDELAAFTIATDGWKNARNDSEKTKALAGLRQLPGKLPKGSKLLPRAKQILEDADRQMTEKKPNK